MKAELTDAKRVDYWAAWLAGSKDARKGESWAD